MNYKAILFDLDGTLLSMDQEEFNRYYFKGICQKICPLGYEPEALIRGIWAGIMAMINNRGQATNEVVFWQVFCGIFGEKARADEPYFEAFYHKEFQEIRQIVQPNPAANKLVQKLKAKGYPLILATNPVFPRIATESRTRWAGLEPADFDWITTYENSGSCKPNPYYYEELLARLDLKPEECLMVGNDTKDDLAAAALGMSVFLLTDHLINKENVDISEIPQGGFEELEKFIDLQ